jgi:hypothetical protein
MLAVLNGPVGPVCAAAESAGQCLAGHPWSAEHDAVAAEVGDDVEPAAERLNIAG